MRRSRSKVLTNSSRLLRGRAWEGARLALAGEPPAANGPPVHGPEILDLPAGVTARRPREEEDTGLIDGDGGCRRDPPARPPRVRGEPPSRHGDLGAEP